MVLDQVELVKHPPKGITTTVRDIAISGVPKSVVNTNKPLHIHEFAIESADYSPDSGNTLVMMHGYGAGLGFFYKNFDGLSEGLPGWNIYALDWLGYGLSARPKFTIKTSDLSKTADEETAVTTNSTGTNHPPRMPKENLVAKETEDWFVESLEAWRREKQIPRFTLMGHSMGGYLAAAYAFKYPERVDKLLMISPVGVESGYTPELDNQSFWSLFKSDPAADTAVAKATEKGPDIEKEVTLNQADIVKENVVAQQQQKVEKKKVVSENLAKARQVKSEFTNKNKNAASDNSAAAAAAGAATPDVDIDAPPKRRGSNGILAYLWNTHVSPFTIVRNSFVFGPKVMSRWSYWRFAQFPAPERDAMHLYAYKTFIAPPSGEYAITRILAPGALARMPIVERVATQLKCPSVWVYGDHDWMHVPAGAESADIMNEIQRSNRSVKGERAKFAEFHVVPQAGHHVYLDNVNKFNSIVLNFIKRKA